MSNAADIFFGLIGRLRRNRGLLGVPFSGGLAVRPTSRLQGVFAQKALVACFAIISSTTSYAQTPPGTGAVANVPSSSIEDADQILRARTPATQHGESARAIGSANVDIQSAASAGQAICPGADTSQAVELLTVAASLKCDTDLIFEYVYDNIEYEPIFGSNKGAFGTLLDKRGSDIDQAVLLSALLRSAGMPAAQISFRYGYIRVTGATAPGWLGVKNDAAAIAAVFSNGGTPASPYSPNPDGTLNYVDVAHVWLQVQIGGTSYAFDPSFKQHTVSAGVGSLPAALGYSQSQFLTDVGGTVTPTSIEGINRAALRGDLTTYANNLAAYIKANGSSWSVPDLVGGKSGIQYLTGSPLRQLALPYLSPSQPSGFPQNWGTSVPNSYRTCFTVSMPGISRNTCSNPAAQTIVLYSDQTYGHRITVFSVASGSNYVPTLLIDGAAPPNGQNTGTALPAGSLWSVGISITHPFATTAFYNQAGQLGIAAGGSYLIGAGWGQVGRGMVEKHRALLAQARASGAPSTSESVLGEALAVIHYSWVAQDSTKDRLLGTVTKTTIFSPHIVGIVAQTVAQGQAGHQGPYVDLPFAAMAVIPQSATAGFDVSSPLLNAAFGTGAGMSSIFESAVLEQTQGLLPGMVAASTVKLVDQNSISGATTYYADGTTTAGINTYFNNIRPNLMSYTSSVLTIFDKAISSDGTISGNPTNNKILIPVNGSQNVGFWTGAGYSIFTKTSTYIQFFQMIAGGLSGGYSGLSIPTDSLNSNTLLTTAPAANTSAIPAGAFPRPHQTGNNLISEPVDSVTGAYIYTNTDLSLGNGGLPYGLPFGRTYSSASNTANVGLGNGWTHSYSISATRSSNPYAGMGEESATAAAPAIAAFYVAQDLLLNQPFNVQNLTLAWMICRWVGDQITNNSVLISQPATNEEFISLPRSDGANSVAYTAPMGSSATLTGNSVDAYGNPTVFNYVTKEQNRLTFNPIDGTNTGSLAGLLLPSGVGLNLAYGYTFGGINYLTQVSNNLGRALTLSWNGRYLSSVSDGIGRSASYGYDGNGNLITVIDPIGAVTRFAYDGGGHLTQIFYPSLPTNAFVTNSYDGIGRINAQANGNGDSTIFYFAGARTETVDPVGDRRVTYQTSSGKVLKDVAILNPTFGNVFNDTAQQSGLAVSINQYDGADRLSLSTTPEGVQTAYTYSPDFLQNLVQLQVTPKPGSPLSPATTTFQYDPTYNKPTSVTDPLGLVTSMTYALSTGNLIQQVQDAGASPHLNATRQFTYDGHGLRLTEIDPLNVVTQYAYDAFGNLLTATRDAGGMNITEGRSYDGAGNLLGLTDPRGFVTTFTYDADRRLVTSTSPTANGSSVLTTTAYDANGNPLQVQQTANGIPLRTTSYTYSPTDKVATAADANGNITRYSYDTVDRLANVTDPVGRVTIYGYDALSRQVTTSNPAIQASPLLATQFSPDGKVGSLTDANGNVLRYTYDGLDRLSITTYPATASIGATTETLTYDGNDNIKTRLTRKGEMISYGYDTLNRRTSKTEPSGTPSVFYSYDLAGRLLSVSDNGPSLIAAAPAISFSETASYDALNRPISQSWSPAAAQSPPAAAVGVTFTPAYDASNRRVSQAVNDNSWIAYPGTASVTSYSPNSLNQYGQVGSVTPTYDANGNLISDGSFIYGYDAESRLVSVAQGGTQIAGYAYDGRGRRKSRTTGGSTTVYVTGAEDQEVLEYNGATGAPGAAYAVNLGGRVDEVLSRVAPGGQRQTLVPDIQGSITAILDSGGVLTKVGYQTFGESTSAVASGAGPRYTARRLDPETAVGSSQPSGLYYYRARTYSPTWGRFLQPDPIGAIGGVNLYTYVGNDPLNQTDPLGLYTLQIGIAGGGAILGIVVPQGGYGLVVDTGGRIGVYSYLGVGVGAGVQAGVGASLQVSNAATIYDLRDAFTNSSIHGGLGIGGSLDLFGGSSDNGPVLGGGISFGPSAGASASLTQTSTQICGFSDCIGSAFPPALLKILGLSTPSAAASGNARK